MGPGTREKGSGSRERNDQVIGTEKTGTIRIGTRDKRTKDSE